MMKVEMAVVAAVVLGDCEEILDGGVGLTEKREADTEIKKNVENVDNKHLRRDDNCLTLCRF